MKNTPFDLTGTVAVITRNIVTGIASITLVNRDPGAPALTQAGPDDPLPVIGEGRSDLDEFAGRVHQMGEQASNALANLNLLEDDFAWATAKLMGIADTHAHGRVVSMLEGGYDLQGLARSVAAHVTTLMRG